MVIPPVAPSAILGHVVSVGKALKDPLQSVFGGELKDAVLALKAETNLLDASATHLQKLQKLRRRDYEVVCSVATDAGAVAVDIEAWLNTSPTAEMNGDHRESHVPETRSHYSDTRDMKSQEEQWQQAQGQAQEQAQQQRGEEKEVKEGGSASSGPSLRWAAGVVSGAVGAVKGAATATATVARDATVATAQATAGVAKDAAVATARVTKNAATAAKPLAFVLKDAGAWISWPPRCWLTGPIGSPRRHGAPGHG